MGLEHLTPQTRHNDNGFSSSFNNTWGHFSPRKNTSYKGVVKFVFTDHGHYGRQAIIITYDFENLSGPYIHDFLFDKIHDLDSKNFKEGEVYEMNLTFRNYRFYYCKPFKKY